MKMRCGSRFNHMVIEHDIRRCAGILAHSFEAVHGGFGAGRPVLNVKADVIVIGINLFAVCIHRPQIASASWTPSGRKRF